MLKEVLATGDTLERNDVMTNFIKWLFFGFLLIVPFTAHGQTINAASCASTDVQNALNSVKADGTTVNIPAGTCHWATTVSYNQVFSTTIQGQTTVTGTCGPTINTCTATDRTSIFDDVNHGGSIPSTLQISTAAGKSFRLTGISMLCDTANTSGAPYNGMISISGSSKLVRADHNDITFCINGGKGINIVGWLTGVIDHNVFSSTVAVTNDIEFQEPGWNGVNDSGGQGNASWADDDHFGTGQFMFAENNLFTGGGWAYDCTAGGRYVFRYNYVGPQVKLQTHGLTSDQHRSCRNMEIYGNYFLFDPNWQSNANGTNFAFLLEWEGGTGLMWGNTMFGFLQMAHVDVVRTNHLTYGQTAVPNGWGYCAPSPIGGVPGSSPWDSSGTGPCMDGAGRGKGDLVTGNAFPNIINSATGTTAWPRQALVPIYAWANSYTPVPQESNDHYFTGDSVTQNNRDYYLELPNFDNSATFDGTAGVGQGLLSARPATCTPSVAYWATDQNTLYQCQAGSTWSAYYTPFAYPHPLISGQTSGTAPAPPTNVVVSVH
jgi:hypothetical protein